MLALVLTSRKDSQSSSLKTRITKTLEYRRSNPVTTTSKRKMVATDIPISLRVGGLSKLGTMPLGGSIPGRVARISACSEVDRFFQFLRSIFDVV